MDESTIRKILYVVLGFVLCMSVMISIICGIFMKESKDKTKGYKEAEGKFVDVIRTQEEWGDKIKVDFRAIYEYEVDGIKYTVESNNALEKEKDVDKKDKIILYNPERPRDSVIKKEKSMTGSSIIFCMNIALTILTVGMIRTYFKHGFEGCCAIFRGWTCTCLGLLFILWNSIVVLEWSAIFLGIAIFGIALAMCIKELNACRGIVTISGMVQEFKDEVRNELDK